MTSNETQIQIRLCRLANVTCKTRDKGQLEKSSISCRCRVKETADIQKLFSLTVRAQSVLYQYLMNLYTYSHKYFCWDFVNLRWI